MNKNEKFCNLISVQRSDCGYQVASCSEWHAGQWPKKDLGQPPVEVQVVIRGQYSYKNVIVTLICGNKYLFVFFR